MNLEKLTRAELDIRLIKAENVLLSKVDADQRRRARIRRDEIFIELRRRDNALWQKLFGGLHP